MIKAESSISGKAAGAPLSASSRFSSFAFSLLFLACGLWPAASGLYAQTELGAADDLAVMGTDGTQTDPDLKVKGFSVFGSTEAAPALVIPAAPGNIFANGYVQVSSGLYVAGSSTFTAGVYVANVASFTAGPGSIFISGGGADQVLKKVAGGGLHWANDEGGISGTGSPYRVPMWNSDTVLTNSVMNQDAGANSVTLLASSMTVGGALGIYANRLMLAAGAEISSAPAAQYGGVYVSTHIYISSNVYVGQNALYVGGGATDQILKKNAGGWLAWGDDVTGLIGGTQYRIPVWTSATTQSSSVLNQDAGGNSVTLMASTLTVAGAQGIYANRLMLAAGAEISSAPAAQYGGVYVSTHIYISSNVYVGQNALYVGGGTDNQVLKKNAAGYLAWANDEGGVAGSGTQYRIPMWNTTSALTNSVMSQSATTDGITLVNSTLTVQGSAFSVGGSTLAVTYGNVGIGTAAPGSRLEVAGGSVTFRGSDSDSAIAGFVDGSNNYRMVVSTAGDVGIGVTAPTHKLHVAGNAIVTSSMAISGSGLTGTAPVFQVEGGTMTVLANGNVGIGTANPAAKLHVQAYEAGTNTLYVSTAATAGEYSIAVSSTGITNIKNLVIENRTDTPPSPVTGQIWLRTDY